MDDDNMPDMNNPTAGMDPNMVMTHMTFWGKNANILFSYWPGTHTGMYVLALVFVFVLSIFVEWLRHCQVMKPGPKHLGVGLIQTFLHALTTALAFMVMLAVMSFNVGIFLVAVAGHSMGLLLFRSRVFNGSDTKSCPHNVCPLSCWIETRRGWLLTWVFSLCVYIDIPVYSCNKTKEEKKYCMWIICSKL